MGKINGSLMLIFLIPVLLLGGCGGESAAVVKAQKLYSYNTERFADMEATGRLVDGVRVIEIKAFQFYFEPSVIIVNEGEKVKLVVTAEDVAHGFEIEGFEIPDYDINTKIRPGMPLEVEFTANKKGVWNFICTIFCGFGHSDMAGTFVIR